MRVAFTALLVIAVASAGLAAGITRSKASLDHQAQEARSQFQAFVREHGKEYSNQTEFENRLRIFSSNLREIQRHNEDKRNSWKMGVNKFSDLTDKEFRDIYSSGYVRSGQSTGGKISGGSIKTLAKDSGKVNVDLPDSIDWRLMGVVTDVKDQKNCGSCWAFAAVEQLESYLKIDSDFELPILSPQQVLTCSPRDLVCGGFGGCFGSIPQFAYTYAQLYGVTSEESYPYNVEEDVCYFNPEDHPTKVFVKGYEVLPHNDQDAIMRHLATVGPLAVALDASGLKAYTSGVFDGCDYNQNIMLNHAVQLVGYGTDEESGQDYWIVRNSWGPEWGEKGYVKIQREKNAQCGLDSTPMAGVGCLGDGNNVQKVCGMCGILFDVSYPINATPTSGILSDL